jgi:hypothetical protein
MKKIAKPFAESDYSVMSKATTDYDLRAKQLKDLKFLRERIVAGKLTPELYDFINMDHSLESLLPCVPRPVEGVACEALTATQIEMLDAVIAQEELNLKGWIERIWEALKDLLMDYFDRNRIALRALTYLRAQWRSNAVRVFGDTYQFASSNVLMFNRREWTIMCGAAKQLNELVKELQEKKEIQELSNWLTINQPKFDTQLKEFGMYINEQGNVVRGSPKYVRQNNVCSSLGWVYSSMMNDINDIISILGDEIEARRQFSQLEALFKKGANSDHAVLKQVKDLVLASKSCNLVCGRIFAMFLKQIARARNREFSMKQQ